MKNEKNEKVTDKMLREAFDLSDGITVLTEDVKFTLKRLRVVNDKIDKMVMGEEMDRGVLNELKMFSRRIRMNILEMKKLDIKWGDLVKRVNGAAGEEVMKLSILDTPELELLEEAMKRLDVVDKEFRELEDGEKWKDEDNNGDDK